MYEGDEVARIAKPRPAKAIRGIDLHRVKKLWSAEW
jgi:hypothetical protein